MTQAHLDPQLLDAYKQAIYSLVDPAEIHFYIGQYNAELHQFLQQQGVSRASFITAYNPRSQVLPKEQNEKRQDDLRRTLGEQHYQWLNGCSSDPQGKWPPEPSLLIFDMPDSVAAEFASSFQQNAYVKITDGYASLVCLK